MKYDFETQLLNDQDEPMTEQGTNAVVTLRYVLKNMLLMPTRTDGGQIGHEEKGKRFELWLRLKEATDETDFVAEEVSLLKAVAAALPPLAYGRTCRLLDQKPQS